MPENRTKSLKDLLKRENVQVIESVRDWQEAVRVSLASLEAGGYVESRYADNVIADTIELGPYYVLTEDVALVHARPEEGAIKTQMAVTLVRTPVVFSEESFPVRLLFALAAEDSTSHVEAIKLLATFCMDPERVEALAECADADEVYHMLIETDER